MDNILTTASSTANILIALATAATLLLIYFQFREMSTQTKELRKSINSATYQEIVSQERGIWEFLSQDEEFMTKYVSGLGLEVPSGLSSKDIINAALLIGYGENVFYHPLCQHE